jgi:DNA polymerase-4
MERTIIHLNVADFAVAVERTVDARLRGRPVIIAPEGETRAAVYDMSEEAYRAGVRKGQALPRARRTCRDATIIAPHRDRYERAMRSFLNCVLPYSPLIEATDVQGHLFIDTTGTERLFGAAMDIAWRIRKAARADLGLDPIWTVAPNKLVAKVASRVVKPTGECLVEAGDEQKFLMALPVQLLPGLEPDDLARLREYRLASPGDVTRWTLDQLAMVFGARAHQLFDSVRGIDPSPVLAVGQQPPKVVENHEFGEDTNDAALLLSVLQGLAEHAGRSLRAQQQATQRVGVALDYSDGARVIRQATPARATANDFSLFDLARLALDRAWVRRVRIRHLRLICDRLTFPPSQLDLFDAGDSDQHKQDHLVTAMDRIRSRFGDDAIYLGRSLRARES